MSMNPHPAMLANMSEPPLGNTAARSNLYNNIGMQKEALMTTMSGQRVYERLAKLQMQHETDNKFIDQDFIREAQQNRDKKLAWLMNMQNNLFQITREDKLFEMDRKHELARERAGTEAYRYHEGMELAYMGIMSAFLSEEERTKQLRDVMGGVNRGGELHKQYNQSRNDLREQINGSLDENDITLNSLNRAGDKFYDAFPNIPRDADPEKLLSAMEEQIKAGKLNAQQLAVMADISGVLADKYDIALEQNYPDEASQMLIKDLYKLKQSMTPEEWMAAVMNPKEYSPIKSLIASYNPGQNWSSNKMVEVLGHWNRDIELMEKLNYYKTLHHTVIDGAVLHTGAGRNDPQVTREFDHMNTIRGGISPGDLEQRIMDDVTGPGQDMNRQRFLDIIKERMAYLNPGEGVYGEIHGPDRPYLNEIYNGNPPSRIPRRQQRLPEFPPEPTSSLQSAPAQRGMATGMIRGRRARPGEFAAVARREERLAKQKEKRQTMFSDYIQDEEELVNPLNPEANPNISLEDFEAEQFNKARRSQTPTFFGRPAGSYE